MPRRAIYVGCTLACLAAVLAAPSQGQSDPASEFVLLKRDDVPSSNLHLAIIVVNTRSEAYSVQSKLESGTSFEALAHDYSMHPSAATGGDFGVFALAELQTDFQTALATVKSGGHAQPIAVSKPATPSGWPEHVPPPGSPLTRVERELGRSYSATTVPADGNSSMTELIYPFGARLRVHETRGLGFVEFTPPWKSTIFGLRPDDQIPGSMLDLFPRTGRFIRGVFVGVPSHPHWFVDVDDRVDAVSRVLFVDRGIYGNLPGLPEDQ